MYYDRPTPAKIVSRLTRTESGGEATELIGHMERLCDFFRRNKPGVYPALTLPDDWKGKPIKELLPKIARYDEASATWHYREFPLKFKGV